MFSWKFRGFLSHPQFFCPTRPAVLKLLITFRRKWLSKYTAIALGFRCDRMSVFGINSWSDSFMCFSFCSTLLENKILGLVVSKMNKSRSHNVYFSLHGCKFWLFESILGAVREWKKPKSSHTDTHSGFKQIERQPFALNRRIRDNIIWLLAVNFSGCNFSDWKCYKSFIKFIVLYSFTFDYHNPVENQISEKP